MYFVDFNKMKVVEETSANPTNLKLINLKLIYRKHLCDNYEMVKNAIASYLDQKQTQIEKTDKVFFSIALDDDQGGLNSDEFISAVNVINAAIFEYMMVEGGVKRKREYRLNAPDNLIRGVHASVGIIKKACNYELKSDVFNIVINLTEHREGPDTYLQYVLVDGKEDK